MYLCRGCEGYLENIDDQCLCGKTTTDHKGRVKGEDFMKMPGQSLTERSKIRACPHCGWEGLVVPRIGLGCPEHGIWYKDSETKTVTVTIEEKDNTDGDQGPEGGDDPKLERARRREENRRRKERETVRRSGGKGQKRHA